MKKVIDKTKYYANVNSLVREIEDQNLKNSDFKEVVSLIEKMNSCPKRTILVDILGNLERIIAIRNPQFVITSQPFMDCYESDSNYSPKELRSVQYTLNSNLNYLRKKAA
jgi:hypothetical protein